jgi:hypothetical protein
MTSANSIRRRRKAVAVYLAVDYLNGTTRYYPVPEGQGWKIDRTLDQLVIGRGVPRTHIPLCTVAAFDIEKCKSPEEEAADKRLKSWGDL